MKFWSFWASVSLTVEGGPVKHQVHGIVIRMERHASSSPEGSAQYPVHSGPAWMVGLAWDSVGVNTLQTVAPIYTVHVVAKQ